MTIFAGSIDSNGNAVTGSNTPVTDSSVTPSSFSSGVGSALSGSGINLAPPVIPTSVLNAQAGAQNLSGGQVGSDLSKLTLTAPLPPAVQGPPTPPAFKATVPSTMDATSAATSLSNPTGLPTGIPSSTDQTIFQMADGRFYNPGTGLSGSTREETLGGQTGGASGAGTTGNTSSTTTSTSSSPPPNDNVTTAISSLFPEPTDLLKQYQDLRTSSGLPALETQLASTNTEIANMNATINNIENDVRSSAAGGADESFIQATVADRMRRLQPRIDQLNAQQQALTANIQLKKDNITQQLGLSQQDIANAVQVRQDTQKGINDLLSTYGSAAFANVAPDVIAQIEKRAGLPAGSINAKAKTLAQSAQELNNITFTESNNHIFKFDKQAGTSTDMGAIPLSQQANIANILEAAKTVAPGNPQAAYDLINGALQQSSQTGSTFNSSQTVSSLSQDDLTSLIASMVKREGYGQDPKNVPTRNNNPGDITLSSAGLAADRAKFKDPGITTDVVKQPDGSTLTFLHFSTPESGMRAIGTLLASPTYANMPVDAALKKWSGNSYGAEILGGGSGGSTPAPQVGSYINPALKNDAATFVSNLLGKSGSDADRGAMQNSLNQAIQSGSPKALNDKIQALAVSALDPSTQKLYKDNASANSSITDLEGSLKQFDTSHPGALKTAYESSKTAINVNKDPQWLKLMNEIQQTQSKIMLSLYGVRITDKDLGTSGYLFIKPNDTFSDMKVKMDGLAELTGKTANTYLNGALGINGPNANKFMALAPDGTAHYFPSRSGADQFIAAVASAK